MRLHTPELNCIPTAAVCRGITSPVIYLAIICTHSHLRFKMQPDAADRFVVSEYVPRMWRWTDGGRRWGGNTMAPQEREDGGSLRGKPEGDFSSSRLHLHPLIHISPSLPPTHRLHSEFSFSETLTHPHTHTHRRGFGWRGAAVWVRATAAGITEKGGKGKECVCLCVCVWLRKTNVSSDGKRKKVCAFIFSACLQIWEQQQHALYIPQLYRCLYVGLC